MKTLEVLERVLKGKRMSENTKNNFRYSLKALAGYSEDWPESRTVINEWLAGIKGKADETVRTMYKVGRSAGEYMRINYELKNPFEGVEVPAVKKKRRRYYNGEEFMRLVGMARSDRDRCLVLGLMDSSARIGEFEGLRGKDVLDGFIVVEGKTGERKYRLDRKLCEMFKAMAGGDKGYVFSNPDGSKMRANTMTTRIRRMAIKAGLGSVKAGAHTLRHSAGSLVARYTRSDMAVKALLQHDNVATSMGYVHDVNDEIQQEISPLRLAMEEYHGGQETQVKLLPDGSEVVEGELVEANGEAKDDGLEDLLKVMESDVRIRPSLNMDDVALIRGAFIVFARNTGGLNRSRCIDLYNRMLRKVNLA